MAGKKKIEGAKASKSWGGARPNSGRPRRDKDQAVLSWNYYNKPYRVVYMLSNGYVGSTNNFERRMAEHRCNGKDVEGAQIVFASYDKKEALAVERAYHADGFSGGAKRKSNG